MNISCEIGGKKTNKIFRKSHPEFNFQIFSVIFHVGKSTILNNKNLAIDKKFSFLVKVRRLISRMKRFSRILLQNDKWYALPFEDLPLFLSHGICYCYTILWYLHSQGGNNWKVQTNNTGEDVRIISIFHWTFNFSVAFSQFGRHFATKCTDLR